MNEGTPLRAYIDVLPKYTKRDYERRGEIIARVVYLERIMDAIIANYFCDNDNKIDEIRMLILSTERITYENKRQVLKWIYEKHQSDIFKSHPKIFKDMQEIGEFRNVLAHNHLDIDVFLKNELDGKTIIHKYKNKKYVVEITEPVFKEWVAKILKYTHALMHWEGKTYLPL